VPWSGASILILGPPSANPVAIGDRLQILLDADSLVEEVSVHALAFPTPATTRLPEMSLLTYFYQQAQRDTRMSAAEGEWDHIVLIDTPAQAAQHPEFHFEGVRTVGDQFEAEQSTVHLLMPISPSADADTVSRHVQNTYRVGVGTGSSVLPVGLIAMEDGASSDAFSTYGAVGLYSALRGISASGLGVEGEALGVDDLSGLADRIHTGLAEEASAVHYDTPFEGVVRMTSGGETEPYRFMTSGTSSERGYQDQMVVFLGEQGMAAEPIPIGHCNPYKTVDEECLSRAAESFGSGEVMSIYARAYEVSATDFVAAGGGDIQPQVYDRHWDSTTNDAAGAVDDLEYRMARVMDEAATYGLAFLPQHLNFAKLKVMDPSAAMLSDGVHARPPIQQGLAAMSYVSRTSAAIVFDDEETEADTMARFGEETIRQWSSLSESGQLVLEHEP